MEVLRNQGALLALHTAENVSLLWGLSAQTAHNSVSWTYSHMQIYLATLNTYTFFYPSIVDLQYCVSYYV